MAIIGWPCKMSPVKSFFTLFFLSSGLIGTSLWGEIILNGVVLSEFNKKPIELASVFIPEIKKKSYTDSKGGFRISFPKAGKYQVLIRSERHAILDQTINLQKSENMKFLLKVTRVRGRTLKIEEKNKRQKLTRKTLSQEELKEVPAGFGDALGALTSLPGIIRSDGFSGSLILRGSIDDGNKYVIDGIPLFYPKHYGGFALVFPNNIIKKTHVFASSPPIEFSQVYGGVIEIETQDDVKEFQGRIDSIPLSLTSIYLQGNLGMGGGSLYGYTPGSITPPRSVKGKVLENLSDSGHKKYGSWIVSARYAYLESIFKPLYNSISSELRETRVNYPTFWDYQAKVNFSFNPDSKHRWKFFVFGSIDKYRKEADKLSTSDRAQTLLENNDAIANVTQIDSDISSHTQSFYYTHHPKSHLKNQFIFYSAFNETKNYKFVPAVPEIDIKASEIQNKLKTSIFAIKDTYSWEYIKEISILHLGIEGQYIEYNSSGTTDFLKLNNLNTELTDIVLKPGFKASDVFEIVPADFRSHNLYGNIYLKNELDYLNWLFALGGRADYLERTNDVTFNGWGNLGHEFETETTIATAGGYYNSFPQINFYKINKPISQQYQISTLDSKPERAAHMALGVEQKFLDDFKISLEGFYNLFYSILYLDYSRESSAYISKSSDLKHLGAEIFFKKDSKPNQKDYFFWVGYTIANSSYKNPETNNAFVSYTFEQEHAVKLVSGYRWISHQVGLRYEIYSGFAYTPFSGAESFPSPIDSEKTYHTPYTKGSPINSKNYPFVHRLDIRYTYVSYIYWGKWLAYIEILNIYNFRAAKRQSWNYFRPFQPGSNPTLKPSPSDLPILVNLGVEVHF